ncbi:MAG: hypothetical protein HYY44_08105, partial [Deltaproteobacteria bacterium]|nr:hypothetical protein [Deltaproteobacteria bacterium]
VCKPGGSDGNPQLGKNAGQEAPVDRSILDYDGDDLTDFTEDSDGNCEYTRPADSRGAKLGRATATKETDWRDADTDHDAYEYNASGEPIGEPLFDITLGAQQARGTDQYDRCPHLNPDQDESYDWPVCLRNYCNKPGLGIWNYTITDGNDADGDRLSDLEEDKNGNCRYDAPRSQYGETVQGETNWLEPDSDGDTVPDFFDACGSQPEIWQAQDYDGDGIPNGLEDADHDCIFYPEDPFETDPYSSEVADGSGLEDRDRSCRNPSLHAVWLELDTDNDGLKNGQEDANGDCDIDTWETDPYSDDTDDDTILDGDDTCRHPTLHSRWAALDFDQDGLPNGDEDENGNCQIDQFETDPYNADTDRDGFQDRDDSCGHPTLDAQWRTRDADGDVLKNGDEDSDGNCQVGPYESDPFKLDTDADGRNDFEDPCAYSADVACLTRCNPDTSFTSADMDSDGDGLKDVEEDSNKNCLFFGIVVQNSSGSGEPDPFDTSIYARDSDGDGLSDRVDGCQMSPVVGGILPSITVPVTLEEETCARQQCLSATGRNPGALKDSDRDGIPDIREDPDFDCVISAESETDRFNADTDGDGLPDGIEDSNKNGTVEIDAGETNPRDADTDDDGIPDGVEDANRNGRYDYGELNPRLPDTDKDEILDGFEDRNKNGLWEGGQELATGPCRFIDETGERILDLTGNPLVPETSGYLSDSDLDGIPDNKEDMNKNGEFTNIGARYKSTLMPGGVAISVDEVTEFGESNPCDNDTDGDGLLDGKEDLNFDGVLNWKDGETSPISPHTFGEPDSSRLERRLGMSGCSLIPEK